MRNYFIFFLLIFIFMSSCSQAENQRKQTDAFITQILLDYPELKDKKYELTTVTRIVDGDTFETESGQKVRLVGVNTPESFGKVEFFGKEASNFSHERLNGKTVYMFQDTGDKDRYGRLLRYIFIENEKTMYNEILLIEGYANTMTVPPNVMYSKKFVELEREARENNKGLWGEGSKEQVLKNNKCAKPKIKGNINSKNEKIYHIPGGRNYEETKAEEMYCSEEEAIAAGYRKAKY
ncbi:thermonuclease family protein [Paenibacillus sp. Dod16]|uniref:thermonuclease family protein n=1 Tax=Paenibacillus sp. Dod16 TaxID=3416392 RepID=UPI003CFA4D65